YHLHHTSTHHSIPLTASVSYASPYTPTPCMCLAFRHLSIPILMVAHTGHCSTAYGRAYGHARRPVGDGADGGGADHDALEEIEWCAERVGHRGLDGIGMRDGHDDVPGVTGHDAVDGARDARLHLGEGFAAGEVEAARVLL